MKIANSINVCKRRLWQTNIRNQLAVTPTYQIKGHLRVQ